MKNIFIVGHKNPDTDSICSPLAYAVLKNKIDSNNKYVAIRTGNVSAESQFILNYFKVDAPTLVGSVEENQGLILVDHNEFIQSVDGVEKSDLLEVVDHHKVGLNWHSPIYMRTEAVGCTATIIGFMFHENDIEINPQTAGLLMSAIISDTLLFKSPTCTEKDERAARALAKIAGVEDIEAYGIEMLKAGTSLAGKTSEEIFNVDFKDFMEGSTKYGVSQVNTMDIEGFLNSSKDEMLNYMNELKVSGNYEFLLLLLTDIIKEGSQLIAVGNVPTVEEAFEIELTDSTTYVPGILSRKKQVIPVITKVLTK